MQALNIFIFLNTCTDKLTNNMCTDPDVRKVSDKTRCPSWKIFSIYPSYDINAESVLNSLEFILENSPNFIWRMMSFKYELEV